jgi:hypothetical protein
MRWVLVATVSLGDAKAADPEVPPVALHGYTEAPAAQSGGTAAHGLEPEAAELKRLTGERKTLSKRSSSWMHGYARAGMMNVPGGPGAEVPESSVRLYGCGSTCGVRTSTENARNSGCAVIEWYNVRSPVPGWRSGSS